jgi:peptidoglycan hydrolase CwlO-like protein
LTRLYQENERELLARDENEKKLKEEIERLSELETYKKDWQELSYEFETLTKKHEVAMDELTSVQKELEGLSVSASNDCDDLKQEIKSLKEERLLSDAHWESILADKEEQIKKETRSAQEKEYELCSKIQSLEERIETLEEALSERTT